MTDKTNGHTPEKIRTASLITPPNRLKAKVGSGGLDHKLIEAAQNTIDKNTVDFVPLAEMLLGVLDAVLDDIDGGALLGEEAIESLIYPAMQLKSHGGMFRFPLVTDISDTFINFLETVKTMDKDIATIARAHQKSIRAVITHKLTDQHPQGAALRDALSDACQRYHAKAAGK